jgi:hypothetical protein
MSSPVVPIDYLSVVASVRRSSFSAKKKMEVSEPRTSKATTTKRQKGEDRAAYSYEFLRYYVVRLVAICSCLSRCRGDFRFRDFSSTICTIRFGAAPFILCIQSH